jgi:hypothetical protein
MDSCCPERAMCFLSLRLGRPDVAVDRLGDLDDDLDPGEAHRDELESAGLVAVVELLERPHDKDSTHELQRSENAVFFEFSVLDERRSYADLEMITTVLMMPAAITSQSAHLV